MTTHELLKQFFGFESFRGGQEQLINSILSGRDVLGIMPTGAGKSLCFQVPAMMLEGITLVVSPLISLMKDQVNSLTLSGIPAAYINSSLSEKQISQVLYNAEKEKYKLLYIAPERLLSPGFLAFCANANITMLTVDEAHCISQWGQDFRPSYSKIPEFIDSLTRRPRLSAFTATATARVREDIVKLLGLENPDILITGFDRQNLYFEVQKPYDKFTALTDFLKDKKNCSGIVYCLTRAAVEEVCVKLGEQGYNAARYHAGLEDSERHKNQDDFLFDRVQIIVATNAFGMGIDKSNVSFVVHYNMPFDVESYYQEAGRAGRDGQNAECLLLYSAKDVETIKWLIDNAKSIEYPDKQTEILLKEREYQRLREMSFYCMTNDCLRAYILKYFGETPPNFCGKCSNCDTNFETVDVSIEAQKIISCIVRMKERYGMNMVIDVLRGSKNEKILRLSLDKLSTYNISERSVSELRGIINHLILNGFLIKTDEEYPVVKLGERAGGLLRGEEKVCMKLVKSTLAPNTVKAAKKTDTAASFDVKLLEKLRVLRLSLAKEQRVPAYVIFTDATLVDICAKMPVNRVAFMSVSGVGEAKLRRYGDIFIRVIKEHIDNSKQLEN